MKKASRSWALPVQDWKIEFRFFQNDREWCHDFYNVSSLSNYFQNLPERGMLVGYGKELPQHRMRQTVSPVTNGRLSLWYIESGKEYNEEFDDVFAFSNYLNRHINIARALSYKPKT